MSAGRNQMYAASEVKGPQGRRCPACLNDFSRTGLQPETARFSTGGETHIHLLEANIQMA